MIRRQFKRLNERRRSQGGFTLTEMLVTLLILVLASTLLATGVPVAIDTYHKTVNSANAQMALSTTLTVLRSELGASSKVKKIPGDSKIYYVSAEGYWASIGNPVDHNGKTYRGLEKQYYKLLGSEDWTNVSDLATFEDMNYPLVSDSAITEPLIVRVADTNLVERSDDSDILNVSSLQVMNEDSLVPPLAEVKDYKILLRFMD